MKPIVACALFGLVLLAAHAYGDCDVERNPDDSDFKHFFRNLGCKVKQGAEDVADAAKPYAEKIGSTVSQKYDELKHKLSDDTAASSTPANFVYEGPTERVLLAPIVGGNVAAAADLPPVPAPAPSALPAAAA